MSFFSITNNVTIRSSIASDLQNSGFNNSEDKYLLDELLLYKKKNIKHDNYFSSCNTFIATSGTFVYKGKHNLEALKLCLNFYNDTIQNDAVENVIEKIRYDSLGNYVVVIGDQNNQYIFVDENGCYAAYYYMNDKEFVVSSSYYHIAKNIQAEININSFFDESIRGCASGSMTPIKNIYRIKANEIIKISQHCLTKLECKLNEKSYNFADFNEAAECLYNEVKRVQIESQCIYSEGATLLFVTGGLDSRLELAFRSLVNQNVYLGYWMGKDIITNGTSEDSEISKKLSEYFGYTYIQYNVSQLYNHCFDESLSHDWNAYGELANIYSHNSKWLGLFNNLPTDVSSIGFGYFGEIFQDLSVLDNTYHSNYTIDDFVKDVYCRNGIDRCVINQEDIYEHIKSELMQLGYEADWQNMSKLDCANLFNRTRYHADTICYNFVNKFCYGFSIFSQKRITDIVEAIPYDWKKGGRLELYLTKKANENCVEIPYFTHHHFVDYDKKKNQIVQFKKEQIINYFSKLLRNTFFYEPLRNKVHLIKQKNKGVLNANSELLKQINKYVENTKFYEEHPDIILLPKDDVGYTLEAYAVMVARYKFIDYLITKEV